MYCATATTTDSLDRRYLDFAARTKDIFAQFPQLEPLRHSIFKDLLIQRNAYTDMDTVKHWLRPMLRSGRSRGTLTWTDVLIWVESCREVIVDALVPLYLNLVERGIKVQLASFGGPANLPSPTLEFRYPARAVAPPWVRNAWEALCQEVEELRDGSLEQTFSYACANNQGLLDEINRIQDIVQPTVVITASTQLSGGAALMVSSQPHVRLLLQHGILQPFYTPLLADYMLTWGQSSNDVLIDLGVAPNKLVALGSPRHDSFKPSTDGNGRATLSEVLSLPRKPTLVFFSNGNDLLRNGDAPVDCAEWLESTASRYVDEINVVVRLHPNEDGSLYQHCSHLTITKGSPDLVTTLEGCDWVGSLCSTVLYDALIYRKPVLQFYAEGWPELADNWKCGLARRISSQDDLNEIVDARLDCESFESVDESLMDQVFANHGRATECVADFVQDQLEKRRYRTSGESGIVDRSSRVEIAADPFKKNGPIPTVSNQTDEKPSDSVHLVV